MVTEHFDTHEMLQCCPECMGELEASFWAPSPRQQRGSVVVWGLSDKRHEPVLAEFPHKKAADQFHVSEWFASQSDCFQQGFKKTKCFQTSRYCSLVKLDFPALHMSSGLVPLHFILLGTLMFLLCTAALGPVSHLWSVQRISALLLLPACAWGIFFAVCRSFRHVEGEEHIDVVYGPRLSRRTCPFLRKNLFCSTAAFIFYIKSE